MGNHWEEWLRAIWGKRNKQECYLLIEHLLVFQRLLQLDSLNTRDSFSICSPLGIMIVVKRI